MQVKRFVAANMRLALKMVREEMGPDAIILSNKRVAEGVELLISIDAEKVSDATDSAAQQSHSGNPFQQAAMDSEQGSSPSSAQSILSAGIEREHQTASSRAEALSTLLAKKSQQQLEQLITSSTLSSTELEPAILPDDHVNFSTSLQTQLDKAAVPTPDDKQEQPGQSTGNFQARQAASPSVNDQHQQLSDMRLELQSMRDLLEQQFKSTAWSSFREQSPLQASFWKRMKRMGIGASVVQSLLASCHPDQSGIKPGATENWQMLMTGLCEQLPVIEDDLVAKGGVFAFVGPTGAGKTTTIGKLAARYVLKHGAEGIALVTTDTVRIAAHEQLRTFGRILNVPVKIVDKNNSLERVMYALRHKSLVLIDTAGLNRQDDRLNQQLASLNEAGSRLRTLLVMPTTSQVAVMKSAFYSYKTDNLCGCVLTKLDESANLGEVITLAIEKSLPIAYTTDGQGIPDDIAVADSARLVKSAIKLAKYTGTDDLAMAEEFGQLSH